MSMIAKSLFVFLAPLVLTGCFTTTELISPMEMSISNEHSRKKVKKAIRAGAAARGWTISSEKGSTMEARLRVRSHRVGVRIVITDSSLEFYYKNSQNMQYEDGVIHKKYHVWVDRLQASIREKLSSM